jgi:hypothetical protein
MTSFIRYGGLALALALAATFAHAGFEYRIPVEGLRASSQTVPAEEDFSLGALVPVPTPVVLPPTETGVPVSVLATLQNRNDESVHIDAISANVAQLSAQGSCVGTTLAEGETCTFSVGLVSMAPLSVPSAMLTISTDRGDKLVPVSELLVMAPAAAQGGFSTPSLDFGTLIVGATASRSVTLRNNGNKVAEGVHLQVPTNQGLSASSNTCGVQNAPITLAIGAECTVQLNWNPNADSSLAGAVLVAKGFANEPTVTFAGVAGTFNASGQWSSTRETFTAVAPDFGVRTYEDGVAEKTLFLRNVGTYGSMHVNFQLAGDVEHFVLYRVDKTFALSTGKIPCGATVAADSVTNCKTDTRLGNYPHVELVVRYVPKAQGQHQVTLTTTSSNGTAVPGALVLTGEGRMDASAQWSTSYATPVAPAPAATDFGSVQVEGTLGPKTVFLVNTGTSGPLKFAFQLEGDTQHFKLYSVHRARWDVDYPESCGSNVLPASASTCVAGDPAANSPARQIQVKLQYAPTAPGTHSVSLKPISANGVPAPQPLVFTGTGLMNATGAWSTSKSPLNSPNSTALNLGAHSPGTTTPKIFYVLNTGTAGPLALGFTLTGDTSQFRVFTSKESTGASTDVCGSVSTPSDVSVCKADRVAGSYPLIRVWIDYKPTQVGSHTLTLTPYSNNGTALPVPLVVQGESRMDAQGTWSTVRSSTSSPDSSWLDFGSVVNGKLSTARLLYLRNTGNYGALSTGFTITGDTEHFYIFRVRTERQKTSSGTGNCVPEVTIAATLVTPCTATAIDASSDPSAAIEWTIYYRPKAVGEHSITITPTTDNGTILPGPLTFSGHAEPSRTAGWSRQYNVQDTPITSFGTLTATSPPVERTVYLRNIGTEGDIAAAFDIYGTPHVSQFRIVSVEKQSASSAATADCGANVTANATTLCSADAMGGDLPVIKLVVQYAPTAQGSHSASLRATTTNGTVLPLPLSMYGTRN